MAVFDAVNTPGGCIGCSVWFRGRERQYLRFLVLLWRYLSLYTLADGLYTVRTGLITVGSVLCSQSTV
jgi:hypothetical protein